MHSGKKLKEHVGDKNKLFSGASLKQVMMRGSKFLLFVVPVDTTTGRAEFSFLSKSLTW